MRRKAELADFLDVINAEVGDIPPGPEREKKIRNVLDIYIAKEKRQPKPSANMIRFLEMMRDGA